MTDITDGGPWAAWYCILTPPQREQRVIEWLKRYGVYSFHPVQKKWRVRRTARPIAGAKSMGDGRHGYFHERSILPGYVFSKFTGLPRWHVLREMPNITGVLGHNGQPITLRYEDLKTLHDLRRRMDVLDTSLVSSDMVVFAPGDKVRVTEGLAIDGFVREVETANPSKEIAYLKGLSILGKPLPIPYHMLAHEP